jgi:hypothetical protein
MQAPVNAFHIALDVIGAISTQPRRARLRLPICGIWRDTIPVKDKLGVDSTVPLFG